MNELIIFKINFLHHLKVNNEIEDKSLQSKVSVERGIKFERGEYQQEIGGQNRRDINENGGGETRRQSDESEGGQETNQLGGGGMSELKKNQ